MRKRERMRKPKEERDIIAYIVKYGRKAYERAREAGCAVTMVQGNKIYRVNPDGTKELITVIRQSRYKATKKVYSIQP